MDYRRLGGLEIPVLSLGTVTFGKSGDQWGTTGLSEATRLVDVALEAGLNCFDTADIYSGGTSEEILGAALAGRRARAIVSTKFGFPMGDGPNDRGASRLHLVRAVEASLRRLRTDYIDIYYLHGFDARTPVEETLRALDDLVHAGKVRYIGASNFSGWHLMKALAVAERLGCARYVVHQIYYSLMGRDAEHELLPLHADEGIATVAWSPLATGALTGKVRRGRPAPRESRVATIRFVPYDDERLFRVVDELEQVAQAVGRTIAQVALNWLLGRATVASLVVSVRDERQLVENLGAVGWTLDAELARRLDAVSATALPYPYWHQREYPICD
jgi:aryl-alcohol dehydrogenase-like predicted oxidoreductase